MKMSIQYVLTLLVAFVLAGVWQGCNNDDLQIGDPASSIEGLTKSPWRLTSAFLVDEGSPSGEERSISEFYTSTENRHQIDFNTDGTFNVTPGDGVNPFPLAGTWAFDLNEAPSTIALTSEGVTNVVRLGAPVRSVDRELQLAITSRSCIDGMEEKSKLGYRFVFERF